MNINQPSVVLHGQSPFINQTMSRTSSKLKPNTVLYVTILLLSLLILGEVIAFLIFNKSSGINPGSGKRFSTINQLLQYYLGNSWPITLSLIVLLIFTTIYMLYKSHKGSNIGVNGVGNIGNNIPNYILIPTLILFNVLMVASIIKLYIDYRKINPNSGGSSSSIKTGAIVSGSILLLIFFIGVVIWLFNYVKKL